VKVPRVRGWRTFRAYLTEEHDGDTFRVMTDGGFDTRAEPRLRLFDVYAPELAMMLPARRAPGGRETTAYVNGWLTAAANKHPGRRWPLTVATLMTAADEDDHVTTFRRYVAKVWERDDFEREPVAHDTLTLNYAVTEFLRDHPDWLVVEP
jgi:hypothetical protein